MDMSQNYQHARVLVVDDNDMNRQTLRTMLEHVGVQVSEAKHGIDAVNRVDAEEFDLVLMDIQMPVLDGRSAARAIRNLDKDYCANLPIIAMTAYAFDEHRLESLSAGMNGHLAKPIELEILYAELQRWLPGEKQQLDSQVFSLENVDYSDLEAALPGVDVKAGISRVVGKRQIYLELLEKFVTQFSSFAADLHQKLTDGEQKEAIRCAHTLKGVAGGVGATQLQNLAGQLEEQLTRQQLPTILPEVIQVLSPLLIAINSLPELNCQESTQDKLPGTAVELREIFTQLLVPLKSFQIQKVKQQLEQLKEKQWPAESADSLQQLEKFIEQYQFNPAVKLVESLLPDRDGDRRLDEGN